MKYRISARAKKDLESIWQYTAENWSVEQANRYYRLLIQSMKECSENPRLGKVYNTEKHEYRYAQQASHLIFYRQDYRSKGIIIVRILHKNMDIQRRIN